jgi:uncharacterized protein YhbP (UPF0306 family)
MDASDVLAETVVDSIRQILNGTRLLGLATVGADGAASACNAFFAFDTRGNLYILTPPTTLHARNLAQDARLAVVVADSQQTGDGGKRGLQLRGVGRLASGAELESGLAAYRDRFPAVRDTLASETSMVESGMESRLYAISPQHFKVFDEPKFGAETWIEATVETAGGAAAGAGPTEATTG